MHTTRRSTHASWAIAVVPLLALAACSSGTKSTTTTSAATTSAVTAATSDDAGTTGTTATTGSSSYSVATSLRQIPTSALDNSSHTGSSAPDNTAGSTAGDIVVVSGDLDEASKLAGASRPKAGDDPQQIVQWVSAITGLKYGAGSTGVAVAPADAFHLESFAQADAISDELGWSALDVSTYVELQAPPQYFTAMTGKFDQQHIDAAQGDRSHDIWSLGGDDFSVNVDKVSPARPLGQALRTGLNRDGWLAQAHSSQPIADWLVGSIALDRDDGLEAVAKALDGQHVYSAMLVRSAFAPDPRMTTTPGDKVTKLRPFDTLGVGSGHDDKGAILVLAYHSTDEQDATANAEMLKTLFTDGTSSITLQPWNKVVQLDDVKRNGKVVVVTMHPLDGGSPAIGFEGVTRLDSFATHV